MNAPVLVGPPVVVDGLPVTPGGRLMTWPICKVLGLTPAFAASRASRATLNLAAMIVKVSPA